MSFNLNTAEILGTCSTHLVEISEHVFVHKNMLKHFQQLKSEGEKAGLDICIASGFRNFERQLAIWNAKFDGKRPVFNRQQQVIDMTPLTEWQKVQAILTYSAIPGTSRHHWGTDIDIYDKNAVPEDYQLQLVPSEYTEGPFKNLTLWLTQYSKNFGFHLPYQSNNAGVAPEPWHISFTQLSSQYQAELQQHPEYLIEQLNMSDIRGKDAILDNITDIFKHYVFNISI